MAISVTVPPLVRPNPPWPVTTPLRLERWRFHLDRLDLTNKFLDVLHGIEFGFSYNAPLFISESRIFPNMPSALEFPDVITKKVEKELEAGRYKGPFSKREVEDLVGFFIAHPIGVFLKDPLAKPRLVEDLSYPRSGSIPSVNSLSDVSGFDLNWAGIAETISLMIKAPDGTQAASIDIEGAYRTIGIRPDEFWMGVIQSEPERFVIDLAAKFGGKISAFIFELPANCFCIIIIRSFPRLDLVRWVDDIVPIRYPINSSPFKYSVHLSDICDLGNDLGFSFASDKRVDFASVSKYLGFLWCWDSKEVLVPEEKRTKYRALVVEMRAGGKVSLESLRALCGKLSHLATIVLEGRVYMRALWRLLAKMEELKLHEKASLGLKESQKADLGWWESKLGEARIGVKLCTMAEPDDSFGLFCDASTSFGIGIVIGGMAEAFKFKPGWDSLGGISRSIGFAEFAALDVLLFFLFSSRKIRDHHLKVYSDNAGVVGAWKNRSSSNEQQNEILGRILRMLISRQCWMTLEYIPSADNPADAPSRGVFTAEAKKFKFRGFPKDYSDIMSRID